MFDKRKLKREIEADRRKAVRDKVRQLRAQIQLARLERKQAIEAIRSQCSIARAKLRATCLSRRERAKLEGERLIEKRRAELGEEVSLEKLVRGADRRHLKGSVRSTAKERSQEDDDQVRANIPRDLLPVFEKHKRRIKAGPRSTRTEAFLEWVSENPDEVYILQNEQAEADIRRMVREHNREARSIGAAALADVPF